MSTIKVTNIQNPSSGTDDIQIATNGDVTIGGLSLDAAAAADSVNLDSSGRLLVGTSSAPNSTESYAKVQIADPVGPHLILGREDTTVTTDEALGLVRFYSKAGNSWQEGARIAAFADAGQGLDDKPSRLVFSTTADGASSPTERMRITTAGYLKVHNDGSFYNSSGLYHELGNSNSATVGILLFSSNNSYSNNNDGILAVYAQRSASSSYTFGGWYSGFSDREFNFRGDGNGYCDGAWSGGGADYAEYFEWSDGNTTAEDRRGISVVLDGEKIRPSKADEEPIGVISGNPSVVGDAAWNKWSGKYLRDDFGTYIQEDYEVLQWTDEQGNEHAVDADSLEAVDAPEDANVVIQQRRKLNPAYDPDVEYISREDRPEWDCVGLMGKLRIRKGQPTGSRWIKMRDISDSVEEWLVR